MPDYSHPLLSSIWLTLSVCYKFCSGLAKTQYVFHSSVEHSVVVKSPSIISVSTSISVSDFACRGVGRTGVRLTNSSGVDECLRFPSIFFSLLSFVTTDFSFVIFSCAVVESTELFSVPALIERFSVTQFSSESDMAKIPCDTVNMADWVGDIIDPFDFILCSYHRDTEKHLKRMQNNSELFPTWWRLDLAGDSKILMLGACPLVLLKGLRF